MEITLKQLKSLKLESLNNNLLMNYIVNAKVKINKGKKCIDEYEIITNYKKDYNSVILDVFILEKFYKIINKINKILGTI